MNTKITVYVDGKMYHMTLSELKDKNLNVVIAGTNGFSHWWSDIVPFHEDHIKQVSGHPTIWCTTKKVGLMPGSSEVSFS